MIYRAHRGTVYDAPENTIPAFKYAIAHQYDQIETDPQLTRDGVVVLLHDDTINRTCRHADGSPIEGPLRVSDLTYAQLMQYDAGIAFGKQFRGTRVPRLAELLELVQGQDISISLDKKIPTGQIDALIDVVEQYDVPVRFSVSDPDRIRAIQARLPHACFDYDVNLEDEALVQVCRLVTPEHLMIWMYLDKPNFAWLAPKAKVSPENYQRVKKYARVGIANINCPTHVKEALDLAPDAIEF